MDQDTDHLFDECRDFLRGKLEGSGMNFVLLLVNDADKALEVTGDVEPEVLMELLQDTIGSLSSLLERERVNSN